MWKYKSHFRRKLHQFFFFRLNLIFLDYNGAWYTSIRSEGSKNHPNLTNFVKHFSPLSPRVLFYMGSKFNTLATIILWGSTKALAPPRGHNCILLFSPQKEMESSQLLKPDLSQRGCSGVSQFVAQLWQLWQLWQLFHNQGGNLTHTSACQSETSRYFDAKEASFFDNDIDSTTSIYANI